MNMIVVNKLHAMTLSPSNQIFAGKASNKPNDPQDHEYVATKVCIKTTI